jgi:hypothetical protein
MLGMQSNREKMKTPLIFGLVFLLGAALGATIMHLCEQNQLPEESGRKLDDWAFVQLQGDIIRNVNYLAKLRRGNEKDVVESLEEELSAKVEQLSFAFPDRAITDEKCVRVLKTASQYRIKNPFKTEDAERDKRVEAFLSKREFTPN